MLLPFGSVLFGSIAAASVSLWATAAFSQTPLVIGALGDSVSAGFNAENYGDNRTLSWSTGSSASVTSLRLLMERQLGESVIAVNEATAGSTVANLPRQVSRLLRRQPDLVAMTLGANDVCTWPEAHTASLQQFQAALRQEFSRLITARPRITLMVASIPDIYLLWQEALPHAGCQEKWERMNFCAPLLRREVTPAQRTAFRRRWLDANAALAQVVAEFPEHAHFVPEVANTAFAWQHISPLDCFHPSIAGQNLLAQMVWHAYRTATAGDH